MTKPRNPPKPVTAEPPLAPTAMVLRITAAERDYTDGQVSILTERLEGMDRASDLLSETVNRTPTEITREVTHLKSIIDERLASVEGQFETLAILDIALREGDLRFAEERDRRYAEVNIEKEKALKIKETADRDALDLARERQREKEAQGDALRDKTLSESGVYAKNSDLSEAITQLKQSQEAAIHELVGKLQPFIDLVTQQQGSEKNSEGTWTKALGVIGLLVVVYIASKSGVKL